MRYKSLAGQTLMQVPSDSDSRNAELLTKAGFVRKLAAGVYSYLPLGRRVLDKIERIIIEEMDKIEGQQVSMPALVPLENWQPTKRDNVGIGFRTMGANEREFVLGWSHEEVVTPLLKEFITSYRDLPKSIYQIQNKFRNEPRAKSGILRGREFSMKDMYSFHTDQADLDTYYERVKEAYLNVFRRVGLNPYVVSASGGTFSKKLSHEFSVVSNAGEDTIVVDTETQEAQNLEISSYYVGGKNLEEAEIEMGEVEVTRGVSVDENAKAHNVPDWKILKTVVYKIDQGFLGIVIRGDLNVDLDKLYKELGANSVRVANDSELEELGLVKGFISPVNNETIPFVADVSVTTVKNFITGANREGLDLIGVNLGRDFNVKEIAHLAELTPETISRLAGKPVEVYKGIEVGNIFQLDSFFSDAFGLKYTNAEGKECPVIMGCYGIGVTRLMGTVVEIMNDESGIIWPKAITPYHVHLISLGQNTETMTTAEKLYTELNAHGVEVLFDDRELAAGRKFNDADLVGIPLRVLVSDRNLANGKLEIKLRDQAEAQLIEVDELISFVKTYYSND